MGTITLNALLCIGAIIFGAVLAIIVNKFI